MGKNSWTWFLVFLAFFVGFGSEAQGLEPAQPVTREQVLAIAEELVTPGGCPSLTLAECTLPTAFKIREEIAQMLAQGMEKEEIIDTLVAKYGKAILGAPKPEGWGLVVWYTPYAVMGMAALALGAWLYSRRRKAQALPPRAAGPALDTPPDHDPRPDRRSRPTEERAPEQEDAIRQMLKKYL